MESSDIDINKQNAYGFHKYLSEQIVKLTGEQERLNSAAGDGTLSFQEQEKALNGALEAEGKRLELEIRQSEIFIAFKHLIRLFP